MKKIHLYTALALGCVVSSMACAGGPPVDPDDWHYSVGGGVVMTPKSIGSKDSQYIVLPNIDIHYKDWFFANVKDGIGVSRDFGGLAASIALAADFNNRQSSAGEKFHGLTSVSDTAALRLKLGYDFDDFTTSAVISSRISSAARRGTTLELEGGYNLVASPNLLINTGVSARFMDSTFAHNLISVSAHDSVQSGLPVYQAGSGLLDTGVYAQAVYRLTDKWSVFSRVAVARLGGDAKNAPFVEKRTGETVALFTNYAF